MDLGVRALAVPTTIILELCPLASPSQVPGQQANRVAGLRLIVAESRLHHAPPERWFMEFIDLKSQDRQLRRASAPERAPGPCGLALRYCELGAIRRKAKAFQNTAM